MNSKKVKDSQVEMIELVLPNDTNILGNLLGGRLMHWIDISAALAAARHCNSIAVTAAVDNLNFQTPPSTIATIMISRIILPVTVLNVFFVSGLIK